MKGKTQATTQEKINDDIEYRPTRSTARSRSRLLREIAIDGEIAIFASSRRRSRSRSDAISRRRDCDRRRDCAVDRDLDPLREIAINGVARSRTGDRDQRRRGIGGLEIADADWRSRTGDRDQRRRDCGLEIAIERARTLSLSLSLSFSGNTLKGK